MPVACSLCGYGKFTIEDGLDVAACARCLSPLPLLGGERPVSRKAVATVTVALRERVAVSWNQAVDAWNERRPGLTPITRCRGTPPIVPAGLERQLRARVAESGSDRFDAELEDRLGRVGAWRWGLGLEVGAGSWRVDLAWLLSPKGWTRAALLPRHDEIGAEGEPQYIREMKRNARQSGELTDGHLGSSGESYRDTVRRLSSSGSPPSGDGRSPDGLA